MKSGMLPQQTVRRSPSCDGFTLTEVLVAMVVLSIGLLGLSAMTLGMGKSLHFSKNLTLATTLAQDQMEAVRHTPYEQVLTATYPSDETIPGYPGFRTTVVIRANNPVVDTKTVVVTTTWPRSGNGSHPHAVTLTTVINKP
jgi:type IV pilus assembly protein PilV